MYQSSDIDRECGASCVQLRRREVFGQEKSWQDKGGTMYGTDREVESGQDNVGAT